VTVVPSTIDLSRYPISYTKNRTPRVGWIGSRTTLPYLKPLGPIFQELGIKPLVIAAGDPCILGFPVEFREWRLEREQADLANISIGVAPLPDSPWERGKCGVKILQYMAMGIPVVASPVGVQSDLVQDGVTGFLARDLNDWRDRLQRLLTDPDLCAQMGAAGRLRVEREFTVEMAAKKVADVLFSVVKARQ
ncbi:MAG: glycosyltransferase family 4 protein, partial [Verrucomicrobiae bacterium]|nr:glycosyltransferase family 4 protein [Verrucomicrobiae bacterium]